MSTEKSVVLPAAAASPQPCDLSGAVVLRIGDDKPSVLFVDSASVDLWELSKAAIPLPAGSVLAPVEPPNDKTIAECLTVEDREKYDILMAIKIGNAVAAERERCAKIAEEYKCGGEKWDCGAIAAKIRSGE